MVTGVEPTMTTNAASTASTAPLSTHTKDAPVKSDRRSNKPIMEKRRRARINNCLNELKTLILDYSKKDPARHSKLEKADILEKTVKHLQELQRQQVVMQQAADPKVLNKFKAGFTDCANEVSRFPGIEPAVKRRLLQHLNNCLNGVKSDLPSSHHNHLNQQRSVSTTSVPMHQMHAQLLPSPPSSPEQDHMHIQHHHQQQQQHHQQQQQTQAQIQVQAPSPTSAAVQHLSTPTSHSYIMSSHIQQTPNGYFLPNGLQVIPTKLSNGSIALVLPQGIQKAQQMQMASSVPQNVSQMTNILTSNGSSNAHIMIPIPSRTASTGSASSNSSSSYEQNMPSPSSSLHYHPPSPNNCYEPMDCKPSIIQHTSSHRMEVMQPMAPQQPLSLVMKKNIKEEDQPWRPW